MNKIDKLDKELEKAREKGFLLRRSKRFSGISWKTPSDIRPKTAALR